jgi:hypothetical protein
MLTAKKIWETATGIFCDIFGLLFCAYSTDVGGLLCGYGDLAGVVGAKGVGVYDRGVEMCKGELWVVLEVCLFEGDWVVVVRDYPVVRVAGVDARRVVADDR